MISRLGLQTCADRLIGSGISSGELKKTALAVELVTSPGVILLDEPVGYRSLLCSCVQRPFNPSLISLLTSSAHPKLIAMQTSGLDSCSAIAIITLLKEISAQGTSLKKIVVEVCLPIAHIILFLM